MDPKEIRTRLGLPEDATNEQVQDALRELNEAQAVHATPNAVTDEGATAVSTGSPEERAVANGQSLLAASMARRASSSRPARACADAIQR